VGNCTAGHLTAYASLRSFREVNLMSEPYPETQPELQSAPVFSAEQLQAMIQAAIATERAAARVQVDQLQATVEALAASLAGTTPSPVPAHGGGPYTKIWPTWSKLEQEAMRAAGEIPSLMRLAASIEAAVL
jgi:hypothetical protein